MALKNVFGQVSYEPCISQLKKTVGMPRRSESCPFQARRVCDSHKGDWVSASHAHGFLQCFVYTFLETVFYICVEHGTRQYTV